MAAFVVKHGDGVATEAYSMQHACQYCVAMEKIGYTNLSIVRVNDNKVWKWN